MLPEGDFEPKRMTLDGRSVSYQPPPPGAVVIAFSDLGVLAPENAALIEGWAERGRTSGSGALASGRGAISPRECPEELSRYWTILPWEPNAEADAPAAGEGENRRTRDHDSHALVVLSRIEPRFLAFAGRCLLAAGRGEPWAGSARLAARGPR